MIAFAKAVENEQQFGKTFNGADTFSTSGSYVLNLFKAVGQRGANLSKEFDLAVSEDKNLAIRALAWTRDIRGGAGEREVVRNILRHMEKHYLKDLISFMPFIPEYGRWDDLLVFQTKQAQEAAFAVIKAGLESKNGLCAKWMPRKGNTAVALRHYLGWTPKRYRKTLVSLSKTVEQQMCANDWNNIIFDHVPSVASARYQKAFFKHASEAYSAYREGLKKVKEDGTAERKINASAIFPYDVIKSIHHGDREIAQAQWNAMPNYLGDQKVLAVVDVSGSMGSWGYYDQRASIKSNVTPLDIALSLGLYTADKLTGAFNGMFMTFSDAPKLQKLTGNIIDKLNQLASSEWGMSTNVDAAFDEILATAKRNNVPQEDMPDTLLIISDMEFNQCVESRGYRRLTNFKNAEKKFEANGYKLPKVVFWHVNGRSDNNPVQQHQSGTALVSGFSPAIFKAILANDLEDFSPYKVMLKTLQDKRYDIPGLTV
jgi:hypothetical protein